jgi:hypothetical protein
VTSNPTAAKSRQKLRSLQWTKIPATRIGSSPNVWSRSSASRALTIPSSLDTFDFSQLECLFAVDLAQPSADMNGTDRKDAIAAEKRRKLEEVCETLILEMYMSVCTDRWYGDMAKWQFCFVFIDLSF